MRSSLFLRSYASQFLRQHWKLNFQVRKFNNHSLGGRVNTLRNINSPLPNVYQCAYLSNPIDTTNQYENEEALRINRRPSIEILLIGSDTVDARNRINNITYKHCCEKETRQWNAIILEFALTKAILFKNLQIYFYSCRKTWEGQRHPHST